MEPAVAIVLFWLLVFAVHCCWITFFSPADASSSSSSSSSSAPHAFSITWYGLATFSTRSLNSGLHQLSVRSGRFLRRWFSPSPLVAAVGLVLGECVLVYNLGSVGVAYARAWLLPSTAPPSLSAVNALSIALPGVTVPLASLPYLSVAVLVAVVCHEAGHALCAESVGLRVKRVGLFWCAFFPGAWVEVDEESHDHHADDDDGDDYDEEENDVVDAERRLTTVTAGVWHNLVLATAALLALPTLPWILTPAYDHTTADGGGTGATVLSIDGDVSPALWSSPLLHAGDVLTSLNDRAVTSASQWVTLLLDAHREPLSYPDGRCFSTAVLLDTARVHARQAERLQQLKGNRTWQDVNDAIDRPSAASNAAGYDQDVLAFACCIRELAAHSALTCLNLSASIAAAAGVQSICLQPKGLVDTSSRLCHSDEQCRPLPSSTSASDTRLPADETLSCALPQLFDPSFRLFAIGRTALSPLSSPVQSSQRPVLFIGPIAELLFGVKCTDYHMRRWVRLLLSPSSTMFAWAVAFPAALSRLAQFTVAVSSSLFILNCLPVPLSDGQQAVALMADLALHAKRRGSGSTWTRRALAVSPRWLWRERNVRWLGQVSLALFAVNVSLTLGPAVYSAVSWVISALGL